MKQKERVTTNHWQDDLWLVEQLRVFQGRAQTKNLAPLAQGPLKRKMPASALPTSMVQRVFIGDEHPPLMSLPLRS